MCWILISLIQLPLHVELTIQFYWQLGVWFQILYIGNWSGTSVWYQKNIYIYIINIPPKKKTIKSTHPGKKYISSKFSNHRMSVPVLLTLPKSKTSKSIPRGEAPQELLCQIICIARSHLEICLVSLKKVELPSAVAIPGWFWKDIPKAHGRRFGKKNIARLCL